MGVMACNEMYKSLRSNAVTNVIVPTDYLRNKWREEKETHRLDKVKVDTINSWMERGKCDSDLLILDEIHGYTGGDVWSTVFEMANYKRILGLTAKQRNKEKDKDILEKYAPIVARVPISECLENGWIAPFTIYNLGLTLGPSQRAYYDDMHSKFIKYFSTFFDLSLSPLQAMYRAMSDEDYREYLADKLNWEPKMIMIHAAQANRVMQKRKKWLYTHNSLFEKTKEIIDAFPEKRIITFSQVTSSADKLEDAIPDSVAYHTSLRTKVYDRTDAEKEDPFTSKQQIAVAKKIEKKGGGQKTVYVDRKNGKEYSWKEIKKAYSKKKIKRVSGSRQKDQALKEFIDGKVDIIHSATALNEGVDIPNIDMGVKTSFNSTIIDSIQRTGRTARVDDENENKHAIEINLYLKNTQSERWLENSQEDSPNVKYIDSINQIFNSN